MSDVRQNVQPRRGCSFCFRQTLSMCMTFALQNLKKVYVLANCAHKHGCDLSPFHFTFLSWGPVSTVTTTNAQSGAKQQAKPALGVQMGCWMLGVFWERSFSSHGGGGGWGRSRRRNQNRHTHISGPFSDTPKVQVCHNNLPPAHIPLIC